ncbi:MAG: LysR family transcriptional regulator [Castellaniella sp.]
MASGSIGVRNLNAIRIFVQVAETQSFTAAAARLDVTPSAVSKAITQLELELNVVLLRRTTRSVRLTNDGASFFERCISALGEIEDAENILKRNTTSPRGRLAVHLPMGFGQRVVVPALSRFMDRYPDLVLDAELSNRKVDLAYESIDVVVHIGEPADARLIARKLCNLQYLACASPDYLAQYGEPKAPGDLERHRCLGYFPSDIGRYRDWRFMRNGHVQAQAVSGYLNFNNSESLLAAACAGLGIAMLADFTVSESVRDGRLIPILREYVAMGPPVSAIYLPGRNLSPKVRAFVNFLLEIMRGEVAS